METGRRCSEEGPSGRPDRTSQDGTTGGEPPNHNDLSLKNPSSIFLYNRPHTDFRITLLSLSYTDCTSTPPSAVSIRRPSPFSVTRFPHRVSSVPSDRSHQPHQTTGTGSQSRTVGPFRRGIPGQTGLNWTGVDGGGPEEVPKSDLPSSQCRVRDLPDRPTLLCLSDTPTYESP